MRQNPQEPCSSIFPPLKRKTRRTFHPVTVPIEYLQFLFVFSVYFLYFFFYFYILFTVYRPFVANGFVLIALFSSRSNLFSRATVLRFPKHSAVLSGGLVRLRMLFNFTPLDENSFKRNSINYTLASRSRVPELFLHNKFNL